MRESEVQIGNSGLSVAKILDTPFVRKYEKPLAFRDHATCFCYHDRGRSLTCRGTP